MDNDKVFRREIRKLEQDVCCLRNIIEGLIVFANEITDFPDTGTENILYIAKTGVDAGIYIWDGEVYVAL